MVNLNAHGEVADFTDESQFLQGHSAFECVAYCASLIFYCGPPGQGPRGNGLEITVLAQRWYGQLEGSNLASNTNGMGLPAEYDMLSGMKLSYHALAATVQAVKEALAEGYPCLICGAEDSYYDVELGDRVPYSWNPVGNHALVASGVAQDGNLLVHDTASIGPDGVRPGPRIYDASKMQLVSATAVRPPWLQVTPGTPPGWVDDGTILTAPNGVKVEQGFRAFVLANHWSPENWPLDESHEVSQLEASNKALGSGTQQFFRECVLEWTQERGVFVMWVGVELLYTRQQAAALYAALQAAKADYAALQAAYAALQAAQPPPDSALQQQLDAANQKIAAYAAWMNEGANWIHAGGSLG